MEVRYHSEVEADLAEAVAWYESQREGLGKQFLEAVDATVARIRRVGKNIAIWREGIRVVPLSRFPYGLYYQVLDEDVVRVLVIRHLHRHPDTGLDRRED